MTMDSATPKKVHLLLVDDDEEDYIIIKKMIEQIADQPFILEWIASFDEACKVIQQEKHDVYLIDYRLGEHTGIDLLQIIRPVKRTEPFILLTGAGDKEVEWASMKLAAADYLVKGSFNSDMLSRSLHYALRRKEIEEQRIQHYIELNRSKDEFISIASHQLRTPATGVKQYLGMLVEGFAGELTASQMEMLNKAYESNERQLRIVSDLLKVAQVDAGKVKLTEDYVGIMELIKDVIFEQQERFDSRQQTISLKLQQPELQAYCDRGLMRMVCENIIDNASKYSQEGTTIVVEASEDDKWVYVAIRDKGVGIKREDQNRLFEKFSRINNPLSTKVGGTGLGLYWAKKIVDLHKGKIKVVSAENEGTVFTISLPKLTAE